jgi:hypothetical protein
MTLPLFPTDNLYKFLALSGLALLVFSVVYPTTRMTELRIRQAETRSQLKIRTLEIEAIEKELNQEIQVQPPSTEQLAILSDRGLQSGIKNAQLSSYIEQTNVLVEELSFFMLLLNIGMFFGFTMAVVGFWLWYHKVQRLLDLIAKKQMAEIGT